MKHVRIGDLLVAKGVLSPAQRDLILDEQRRHHRPFGVLAENIFGVHPEAIESAWSEQFAAAAEWIDPTTIETIAPELLGLVERRQAWQFGVLPWRLEGDELTVVSTPTHLPRAMRFVGWRIALPASFVLAETEPMGRALNRWYAIDGLDGWALSQRRLTIASA